MKQMLYGLGLVLSTLLLVVAVPDDAAAKSRKEKKAEETPEAPKPLTPYEKLFKDKQYKTVEGLFKLHLIEGKLYTEIPLDILEREFVIQTTIEESSVAEYGMAGQQPLPPYHITFTKNDSLVQMREVPTRVLTDGDPNVERALAKNTSRPIVANYPIKAYNADSSAVVIENTALFLSDNEHLLPFESQGMGTFYFSTAKYKSDLSFLKDVRGGEKYVSVISDMTYGVTTIFFIFPVYVDRPYTAVANRTITMLPETVARERIADPRIGVTPVPYQRFTTAEGSKPAYFSSRLNIREENGAIRPVTVYVDTLFSRPWAQGIREGVELWNDAFRQIGCGDVLRTELFPSDSTFDSNDPALFCVKYVASTSNSPMVNVWTDPRSGEITGARIHFPVNMLDVIRARRFIDLSAVDPAARNLKMDDAEITRMMRVYAARSMAQVLGLEPNYAAASAYPTDSLRSATFTQQYGICSSITVPNDYNYVAQPEDVVAGVRLVNDRLGVYDYFAIRWLYGTIDGADTPEQERAALSRMLTEKAGDPYYYYGNFIYDYYFGDVRLAYTNLGDDPILRTRYRLQNLRYTAAHAAEWLKGKDPDFSYRDEVIADLASGVTEMISYLSAYVGGIYYNEVVEGDGQRMQQVVPKEMQRRALTESLKAIEDLSWLDTELTEGRFVSLSESVQSSGMMTILKKLENLERYQQRLPDSYTPQEMSDDLMAYIFRDVKAGRTLSEYNRQLQQGFVGIVIGYSRVTAQPKSSSSRSAGIQAAADDRTAWGGVSPLRDALYGQPAGMAAEGESPQPFSAYGNYRPRFMVKGVSDHIYYGILLKVRDIYRQGVAVARDASSRDFCRFMLDKVEQSLKTQ